MAKFKPFKFNPIAELDLDIPKRRQKEALREAADFLRTAMLDHIADAKSPVKGGTWKRGLSKEYAEIKEGESSSVFANLELTGQLLDNLTVEVKGESLVIDVDSADYGKAEGHITGQYGDGKMKGGVKPRQFMPQRSEQFRPSILADLKKLLEDYEE